MTGRAARILTLAGMMAAGLFATAGAGLATAGTAPAKWIHIATGGQFTCGIREGNTLWCWGRQFLGELGTGTNANANQPEQISRPTAAWMSVAAGDSHGCATRKDGGLWCWGSNESGELGIGTTVNVNRPHQVTSPAAGGWTSVTAGYEHTCAVRAGTTLWCWGWNRLGQLGLGSTTPVSEDLPQQVTTPAAAGWSGISASGNDTCAVRSDSALWCWGVNGLGQLGIGTSTTSEDLPQQVTTPASGGWLGASTGGDHTCAVRSDSTLWCWGSNFDGQLGLGNTAARNLPQQVTTPAATGWTSVAAAGDDTCATRTHALWCWGGNNAGQLGIGSTTRQLLPQRISVPAATGWTLVSTSGDHTCATRTGHALWCWGANQTGALGIGSTTSQSLPQQVTS